MPVVQATLRPVATALVIGTTLVFAVDMLLHAGLGAIRGENMPAPWPTRLAWIIAAALFWLTAPMLPSSPLPHLRLNAASRITGGVMIVAPVLWLLATFVVVAVHTSLQGDWAASGRRFIEPYLYSDIVLTNTPWLLAGATLLVLARHLPD